MRSCSCCGSAASFVYYPGNVKDGIAYCAVDLPHYTSKLLGGYLLQPVIPVAAPEPEVPAEDVELPSHEEPPTRASKKRKPSTPAPAVVDPVVPEADPGTLEISE